MSTLIEVYCNLSNNSPALCNSEKGGLCTREDENICPYRGNTITMYTFEVTIQMQANSKVTKDNIHCQLHHAIDQLDDIEEYSVTG